ncbi:MAG: hypothetical protein WCD70_07510 [Alphaproteobacteria bacterium]
MRPLPVLDAEEAIAHQLAEIGLRLHKLGRLEVFRQVITARNDLLALIDDELAQQTKQNKAVRGNYAVTDQQSVIDANRPKSAMLKVANHAR